MFEAVCAAYDRLKDHANRTPVMTSRTLNEAAGAEVFLKCENFQRVGAFKFRGACNAVSALPADRAARGVATHSSGNHAQALALAARLRDIPAYIVMPDNAPAVKKAAVAGYGGADKRQVQEMVRMLLDVDHVPQPDDAADAVAVAICHIHSARMAALIEDAT